MVAHPQGEGSWEDKVGRKICLSNDLIPRIPPKWKESKDVTLLSMRATFKAGQREGLSKVLLVDRKIQMELTAASTRRIWKLL